MCGSKQSAVENRRQSASEPVESSALTLKGVDDIERGDRLALGVLGVGDGVTDDSVNHVSTLFKWQKGWMAYDSRKDLRTPRVSS